jgi:hypothetical protein
LFTLDEDVIDTCCESVNLDFVDRIGSFRGAGLMKIEVGGRTMTLRHALAQLAVRTRTRMPYRDVPKLGGVGRISTYWRESATVQDEPKPLRRMSGVTFLEMLAEHVDKERLDELVEFGLSPFMATVSPFAGPRILRHITRFRPPGIDVDQSKAAIRAMVARHPGSVHLLAYLESSQRYHDDLGDSSDVKEVFRSLLCGGGQTLLDKYAAAVGHVAGPLTKAFREECVWMMSADVANHPALLRAVSSREFPTATVTSILNMRFERIVTDSIKHAIERIGLGVVSSYEHDGLYVSPSTPIDDVAKRRAAVLVAARTACEFAEIKPYPDRDAIMATLNGCSVQ